MKKLTFILAVITGSLFGCQVNDVCQCEISKKTYDDKGNVTLDYQRTEEKPCSAVENKDESKFQYSQYNCN